MSDSESQIWIVSRRTRWLAIATGLSTAVAVSVSITFLLALVPILLILSAIAQPRYPRTGLGMMLLCALSLSLWVIPMGLLFLSQGVRQLRIYHDFNAVAVTSLYVVSFILVVWCDFLLAIEFLKLTRLRSHIS